MRQIIITLIIAILIGFVSNFIWLYEILTIKDWQGLNWLNGYMYSVIMIIPLTMCSYIFTIRAYQKIPIKNILISFFGLSIVSWISFEMAREFFYILNFRFWGFSDSLLINILLGLIGFFIPNILFSVVFYKMTNRFLLKITMKSIFLFWGLILFSVVLGLLTIRINSGFGSGRSFIDSVKMGYEIFWLNIGFWIVAIIMIRKNKN